MTASVRSSWPLPTFAVGAAAAYLTATLVGVPALATVARPDVLAAALVVDLAVLVPLGYGLLLVRHGGWRAWTLAPVVAASGAGAWAVLPAAHRGLLEAAAVLVPVVEVGVVALVVAQLVRAVRGRAEGDRLDRLRAATTRVLGDGLAARALAYELAVVAYALGPRAPAVPDAFPGRRSSGYGPVLAGVGVAAALELVGGHLLVRYLWGDAAALVHLALSGYAVVWLVGDWRALGARPTRLDGDVLRVRCGLRWSADVPLSAIRTVYRVRGPLPTDRPLVDATPFGRPDLILDLDRPVVALGPYGVCREVERLALGADDPERLVAALATEMAR